MNVLCLFSHGLSVGQVFSPHFTLQGLLIYSYTQTLNKCPRSRCWGLGASAPDRYPERGRGARGDGSRFQGLEPAATCLPSPPGTGIDGGEGAGWSLTRQPRRTIIFKNAKMAEFLLFFPFTTKIIITQFSIIKIRKERKEKRKFAK